MRVIIGTIIVLGLYSLFAGLFFMVDHKVKMYEVREKSFWATVGTSTPTFKERFTEECERRGGNVEAWVNDDKDGLGQEILNCKQ